MTREMGLQAEGTTSRDPEARGSLAGVGKQKKFREAEPGKPDRGWQGGLDRVPYTRVPQ